MKRVLILLLIIANNWTLDCYGQSDEPRTGRIQKIKDKVTIYLNEFSQVYEKDSLLKPELVYEEYEGYTIADITITIIDPVGLTVDKPTNDSLTKFAKFMNAVTLNTPKKIAYSLLQFEVGQTIHAPIFAQTERIIRDNAHNKDVLIKIIPIDSSNARVEVILQDKLCGTITPDMGGDRFGAGVSYNNLLGVPIEMLHSVVLNFDRSNLVRYKGHFYWNQIGKSKVLIGPSAFIEKRNQYYGFRAERYFMTENTKWAGKFNNYYYRQHVNFDNKSVDEHHYFQNHTWLAIAIDPKFASKDWAATRVVLSGNIYINQFFKRPFIDNRQIRQYFFTRRFYIASVGLANWDYYKELNVFNPNRISFLPRGLNTSISAGLDYFEKQDLKLYIATAINYGLFANKFGHLFSELKMASFFNEYADNEYNLQCRLNYISPLYNIKKWGIRYFVYNQLQWYYNKPFEMPYNSSYVIAYDEQKNFYSNQNYTLSIEPVIYCPYTFAGFNAALFAFADLGVFGMGIESQSFSTNRQITAACGAGIRINNPDIGLGFVEISFAYYPMNIADYPFRYQVPISFINRKDYRSYNLFDADYINTRQLFNN